MFICESMETIGYIKIFYTYTLLLILYFVAIQYVAECLVSINYLYFIHTGKYIQAHLLYIHGFAEIDAVFSRLLSL